MELPQGRLPTRTAIIDLVRAGWSDAAIANELGAARQTVARWRKRAASQGAEARVALHDAPRNGRPLKTTDARVILASGMLAPEDAEWDQRGLAGTLGLGLETVRRTWSRWGVRRGPAPLSKTRVLPTECVSLAGLHVHAPDAALAYWCAPAEQQIAWEPGVTVSEPAQRPALHHGLSNLADAVLDSRASDHCFNSRRDRELLRFLRRAAESRPVTDRDIELRVILSSPTMIDALRSLPVPTVLSIPPPGTSWQKYAQVVLVSLSGSAATLASASTIAAHAWQLALLPRGRRLTWLRT